MELDHLEDVWRIGGCEGRREHTVINIYIIMTMIDVDV